MFGACSVGSGGQRGGQVDAADQHYTNDGIICRLELDVDGRIAAQQKAWLGNCTVWLTQLFVLPCPIAYIWGCYPVYERKVAAAHRLTLRERTLLYEVDEHLRIPFNGKHKEEQPPMICHPSSICGACCSMRVPARREVLRLAELGTIEIEPPISGQCTCTPQSAPHLVITSKASEAHSAMMGGFGGLLGALSGSGAAGTTWFIAGPKNGENFIEAVKNQARIVEEQNLDANPPAAPQQQAMQQMMPPMMQQMMQQMMQPQAQQSEVLEATVVQAGIVGNQSGDSASKVVEDLARLADLKREGLLTDEQFEKAKAGVLLTE